ncbi:ABC transporter substrate-binding protein [Agrococcus jejuensis]|uniref:Extracellular solute-binding protein n=1 Tax=Agrococcus jejuensis TaxID=399736 RepID=A0A1G8DT21_9MICO|nr:extracellular solute-binding protein [Agrococcus jejuensis]SDH60782.1 extracellular solute-binding protein [Agrococcus jejuensis]
MPIPRIATVSVAALAALTLAACQGGPSPDPTSSEPASGPSLRMLVDGTPAEVDVLQTQVDAWSETSGSDVRIVLASDLEQQLAESFANANPPDVFALPTTSLERYEGYLEPYGRFADAGDIVPSLLDVVSDGSELQCVPRSADATTLAISEQAWADAGLTDADVPTTWEQLETIAGALTTDDAAGLAIDPDAEHLGALLAQAGGALVDESGAVADSPENASALDLAVRMHDAGALAWPSDLGASSAAAAFATGEAAMAYVDLGDLLAAEAAAPAPSETPDPTSSDEPERIEPTETLDASDAPESEGVDESADPSASPDASASTDSAPDAAALLDGVRLVPLPAGPANAAAFASSSCWAIPADTRTGDEARDLIAFLTQAGQQVELADATGTVPVTTTAGATFAEQHPERAAVVAAVAGGADMATVLGPAEATDALDETLATLASAEPGEADVAALLADLQTRLEQQLE